MVLWVLARGRPARALSHAARVRVRVVVVVVCCVCVCVRGQCVCVCDAVRRAYLRSSSIVPMEAALPRTCPAAHAAQPCKKVPGVRIIATS